jgi:hypothetical protein
MDVVATGNMAEQSAPTPERFIVWMRRDTGNDILL